MIPIKLIEALTDSLARWDGRGPPPRTAPARSLLRSDSRSCSTLQRQSLSTHLRPAC